MSQPSKEEKQEPIRRELDGIKKQLLTESNRAQEATQNLLQELADLINIYENKKKKLELKLEKVSKKIDELNKARDESFTNAEEKYKETVDLVFKSFNIEPPWQAKFELDDNKVPIAVLFIKEETSEIENTEKQS